MKEINFSCATTLYDIPIYKCEDMPGFFVIMGSDNNRKIYRHLDTMKEIVDYLKSIVIIETFRR